MDSHCAEALVHAAPPFFARLRGKSAHIVFGRRLYPFNHGHLFLLAAFENPYAMILPAAARESDLMTAVEICSTPAVPPFFPLGIKNALSKKERAQFIRIRAMEASAWLQAGNTPETFQETEMQKFLKYLQDYNTLPDHWHGQDSKAVQSPVPLYRVMLLQHLFPRLTEKQCWAMPVGEAAWRCVAMLEAQGHDPKLMTNAHRASIAKINAASAPAAANTPQSPQSP